MSDKFGVHQAEQLYFLEKNYYTVTYNYSMVA